jgi:hypothetical protein
MKKLNNAFSVLYVLSFVISIWIILSEVYEIKAILGYATRPEGILGILYLLALLLSAFYHNKISKKDIVTKIHKSFLIFTSLTFMSLLWLVFTALACRGEACIVTIFPAVITVSLWVISLILGTIVFKQNISQ